MLSNYGCADSATRVEELEDRSTSATGRPLAFATGEAGTVFLCHPRLVHAAQPHSGARPRFLAQPPLLARQPSDPRRSHEDASPVEVAIQRALGRGG